MKNKIIRIVCTFSLVVAVFSLSACGEIDEQDMKSYFATGTFETSANVTESVAPEDDVTVFVHICGEVIKPGVYEVYADSRICDVLLLADGFTSEAATNAVNLAEQVKDGMMVVIPSQKEYELSNMNEQDECNGLINLNTATIEELCTLPGIGESRAKAIVSYREQHGMFTKIENIMMVSGIKEGMFSDIRELIYVKN